MDYVGIILKKNKKNVFENICPIRTVIFYGFKTWSTFFSCLSDKEARNARKAKNITFWNVVLLADRVEGKNSEGVLEENSGQRLEYLTKKCKMET